MLCEKRNSKEEPPIIKAYSNVPVTLVYQWDGGKEIIRLGMNSQIRSEKI